ncbi:MAG: bifunctional DNA-formamidopyrimidine glycosylase/DNA-(apurinic or apyrimidinic site) lyase [Acidimicrobiia bacterium]|nr:bifunctional DNA-formamidopyrimidine glycosylase/DNA-(apurinic or apyrimidinic site) lyase [Acidimicrobiia bacterium]
MPELPEVETIRRQMERDVVGKKIKTVDVSGTRSVRRQPKKQFISRLEGTKLTGVRRKGKFIMVTLDSGDLLLVHLRMSGQLLRTANKDEVAKHTHVTITFTQHGQLRYVDPRTFGELFVTNPDTIDEDAPDVVSLGIDPVEEPMSWTNFGRMLMAHKMKLKAFLTDQTILAGIGNIYSDEILFAAGLRYDRTTDSLSTMEIRRLYRAVVETLHDAIKFSGSTLADDQYVDLFGKPGEYQEHHQVYGRDKLACRRCRSVITKAKFAQRSTYFCPDCQM